MSSSWTTRDADALADLFTETMAYANTAQMKRWAKARGLVLLGSGESRAVFARGPDDPVVLKLVFSSYGREANQNEARAWREASPAIRKHLVPVVAADPEGRWLIMERVKPMRANQYAAKEAMEALRGCGFLDLSRPNFSADGRVLDYGNHIWFLWKEGCSTPLTQNPSRTGQPMRHNPDTTGRTPPKGLVVYHYYEGDDDPQMDRWAKKAWDIALASPIRIKRDRELTAIAVLGKKVVGGGWSATSYPLYDEGEAEFTFDIVVAPEAQRKGVGDALVEEMLKQFRYVATMEDMDFVLNIEVVNPAMERILARRGFTRRGEDDPRASHGDVMMTRRNRRNPTNPQVDTPAFKRWFGKSVTTDRYGKPEVFYHGSDEAEIESFEVQRTSYGYFFTPDIDTAAYYGDNIYEVYLKIENLADFDDPLVFDEVAREALDYTEERDRDAVQKFAARLYREGYGKHPAVTAFFDAQPGVADVLAGEWDVEEMLYDNDVEDRDVDKLVASINLPHVTEAYDDAAPVRSEELREAEEAYGGQDFYMEYQDEFLHAAERLGYDGVVFADPSFTGEVISYVVFSPKQIKSATRNAGTFDPDDPNIYRNPRGDTARSSARPSARPSARRSSRRRGKR